MLNTLDYYDYSLITVCNSKYHNITHPLRDKREGSELDSLGKRVAHIHIFKVLNVYIHY